MANSELTQPTILIIFGISGDLSGRMLLPAIDEIARNDVLPQQFRIVGVTRRPLALEEVLPEGSSDWLREHTQLLQIDTASLDGYKQLSEHLRELEADYGAEAQRLYYLSVPPDVSNPIIVKLGESGLAKAPDTKLLLEKPFGVNLASAEQLVTHIHEHFLEEQIYRIDHFLAKEMAQNLVVFRAANSLFRGTWNHEFIEKITITTSEHIGIEGRTNFYEQTGALRDLIQSHLLQLAALTLMELPKLENPEELPAHRLAALEALRSPQDLTNDTLRGQYDGYRDEAQNQESRVETMARLTLTSTSERWQGVPITIETGKALKKTYTEIRLHYRQEHAREANELVLRIQPNEGISVALWVKRPGYDREFERRTLSFDYDRHYDKLPKAYERVFVDAMRGDHSLFATSAEVLASWRIIQPVLDHWDNGGTELRNYGAGSDIREL